MKFSLRILTFFGVIGVLHCANILVVVLTPFYSHQATYRPLWRDLAKRGHNITILTTHLMEKNENITQIDCSSIIEVFNRHQVVNSLKDRMNFFAMIQKIMSNLRNSTEEQLMHPGFVRLLKDPTKFDLLFTEATIPIFSQLSSRLGCPNIGLSSMDTICLLHKALGNSAHPAIYPYPDFVFMNPLSFKERLVSTILTVTMELLLLLFSPMVNEIIKKHFGIEKPDTYNVYRNASLVFINSNPIFYPPRPMTPKTINLYGGLHLKQPKLLPKDIQEFLDNSKDGCIYFSFGSIVNNDFMSEKTVEVFRETFEELSPMRVLWKFDNVSMNKPDNVMIRKWVPQQDILRHPNIKLFITHGGLHSMEEAVDNAVPMIAIPFYGDQHYNTRVMSEKKFGIHLDHKMLTKESLKNSIDELLRDPMYTKNIQKLSKISKDQPMTGLEKAVWWTEYVLRHGGTEHLRSPSADIPLYQYFFLDILAFVIVVLIFFCLIFYYSLKLTKFVFVKIFRTLKKEKIN